MTGNILDALAEALAPALAKGQKSATGTPTTYYNHGTNGLFSTAGINQDVIATVRKVLAGRSGSNGDNGKPSQRPA